MTVLVSLLVLALWASGAALAAALIAGGVRLRRGPLPGEPRQRPLWRRRRRRGIRA